MVIDRVTPFLPPPLPNAVTGSLLLLSLLLERGDVGPLVVVLVGLLVGELRTSESRLDTSPMELSDAFARWRKAEGGNCLDDPLVDLLSNPAVNASPNCEYALRLLGDLVEAERPGSVDGVSVSVELEDVDDSSWLDCTDNALDGLVASEDWGLVAETGDVGEVLAGGDFWGRKGRFLLKKEPCEGEVNALVMSKQSVGKSHPRAPTHRLLCTNEM